LWHTSKKAWTNSLIFRDKRFVSGKHWSELEWSRIPRKPYVHTFKIIFMS
jgi:hypothetical protein